MKNKDKDKKVFISYSTKDKSSMDSIRSVLTGMYSSKSIFVDKYSIDSGDKWEKEIYKNIISSEVFVVVWSKNSAQSVWVRKEIEVALILHNKFGTPSIFPIIIDNSKLSSDLEPFQASRLNIKKPFINLLTLMLLFFSNVLLVYYLKYSIMFFLLNVWVFIFSYSALRASKAPWSADNITLLFGVIEIDHNLVKYFLLFSLLNTLFGFYYIWLFV